MNFVQKLGEIEKQSLPHKTSAELGAGKSDDYRVGENFFDQIGKITPDMVA